MLDLHLNFHAVPVLIANNADAAAAGGGGMGHGSPNPPAKANGICAPFFSQVTYRTDSFSTANVDIGTTYAKGYQWYPWNWFGKGAPEPADHLSLNRDGSISAVGTSGPSGQLVSAAQSSQAPYFVGKAFGGGFCVEAEISFDPTRQDTSKGWPAFWGMALEHLNQRAGGAVAPRRDPSYEHFIELDFMEVYKRQFPEYLGSAIDWYGQYRKSCPPSSFCKIAKSFDNIPGTIPANTDWSQWHRVGAVWYPGGNGSPGSITYYFDGKPLAPPFVWHDPADESLDPQAGSDNEFSVLDRQHIVLIFGSNTTPIRIRSVIVRQHNELHNLTN